MQRSHELRKHSRVALKWPLQLCRQGESEEIATQTENLSSHGFYCLTDWPFNPGDLVECIIGLPEEQSGSRCAAPFLRCRARVLRVDPKWGQSRFGIACQIEDYALEVVAQQVPVSQYRAS
jgi:PilZ domain